MGNRRKTSFNIFIFSCCIGQKTITFGIYNRYKLYGGALLAAVLATRL